MLNVEGHGAGMGSAGEPEDAISRNGGNLIRTADPSAHVQVFLDLWGVLLDSDVMQREYGIRLARTLAARFGGDEARWTEAHTAAWTEYVRAVEHADWGRESWRVAADRLDAGFAVGILERMGVAWKPPDAAAFSRELDLQVMSGVNARFPDARAAVERLRTGGHSVYVATQATEANARGALQGAELVGSIDGLFSGTSQNALKSRTAYWAPIASGLQAQPAECVLVDDRMDYLEAATSVGFTALLLDREGVYDSATLPGFVKATLRTLAGLPHFVDVLATDRGHPTR
jgi:FMN phosphatase YigB (HAD superfamily)